MEEKRNFVRVKGLQDIGFRVKGQKGSFTQAAVKNISLMGVSILRTDVLPAGSHLELLLDLPGNGGPMSIDGTVVWQTPDGSGRCTTGIQFTTADPQTREQLSKFIMACARRVEEKREFVRCALEIQVSYRHAAGAARPAQSIDISRGGMKMLVNESLPLNTRIALTFSLPKDPTAITCTAEVVWLQPGDSAVRRIGVRFLDISQRDTDRVWAFVTQHCAGMTNREEI